MQKIRLKVLIFVLCSFIFTGAFVDKNAASVKAYEDVKSASVTTDGAGSWLGDDDKGTDGGIYQTNPGKKNSKDKKDKDQKDEDKKYEDKGSSDLLSSVVTKLIKGLADSLDNLLNLFDARLDCIIFGRVVSKNPINYFGFELSKGNIYGFIGTYVYSIFSWAVILFFIGTTLFKLATGVYDGNTPQRRAEMKSQFGRIIVLVLGIYIMPYIFDVVIYLRDVFLYAIKGAINNITGGRDNGSITELFSQKAESPFTAFLYLASVFVSVYFMYIYLQLAISIMLYFIMFPIVCALSLRDKSVFDNWVSTQIAALLTPIIDASLFIIPCVLISTNDNEDYFLSFITLLICMVLKPARQQIYHILNLNNNADLGGALNFIAAAKAYGAAAKRVKNVGNKWGEAFSELGAAKEADKKGKMNEELNALDNEDGSAEASGAYDTPLQPVEDMMKSEKEGAENSNEIESTLFANGANGESEAENQGLAVGNGEFPQGTTSFGGVGIASSASSISRFGGMSGNPALDEKMAELNDATALEDINKNISSMNTELNGINIANAGLNQQKAEYMDQAAAARESVDNYNNTIRDLQSQNVDIANAMKTTDKSSAEYSKLEIELSSNNAKIEDAKNSKNIAVARLNEANQKVRSTDKAIASNNAQKEIVQENIRMAKENAQSIKDNASVRKTQIAYNNASKAQARQAILDKYANVSNFTSPEFNDISPERRVELERKLHMQNAKKAFAQAAVGTAGLGVGMTVGAAAGLFHGADKTVMGAGLGGAIGGGIGQATGAVGLATASGVKNAAVSVGRFANKTYHTTAANVYAKKAMESGPNSVEQSVYLSSYDAHASKSLRGNDKIKVNTIPVLLGTPNVENISVPHGSVASSKISYDITKREINKLGNMLKNKDYSGGNTLREQMDTIFASRHIFVDDYKNKSNGSFDEYGFGKQVRAVVREAGFGMSDAEVEALSKVIISDYKKG